MPNLQEHQLRVAAVAKQICDNLSVPVDTKTVVKACLLHDMGNIIKADLAHWQSVKEEFINKYGPDDGRANLVIAKEVGITQPALDLIGGIGFTKLPKILATGSLELQLCEYSDLRVSPHGVVPIEERLQEGRRRYEKQGDRVMLDIAEFNKHADVLRQMEKQLFAQAQIGPADITDESVASIIEQLKTYEI